MRKFDELKNDSLDIKILTKNITEEFLNSDLKNECEETIRKLDRICQIADRIYDYSIDYDFYIKTNEEITKVDLDLWSYLKEEMIHFKYVFHMIYMESGMIKNLSSRKSIMNLINRMEFIRIDTIENIDQIIQIINNRKAS